MLHEFLNTNREDLISRCRAKVSRRASPPATAAELEQGLPLFLNQLIEALADDEAVEQAEPAAQGGFLSRTPPHMRDSMEADRSAALHGTELFRLGYTVEQVVHDYGDLCQAITELAQEINAPVTVGEYHTFNRLLDNAIASAVSAYARHRRSSTIERGGEALHEQLGTLADEQRMLLDTALRALDAIKVGNIGLMGATGAVLEDSLVRLRYLIDRSLPEIRVATGMVTSPHT